MGIEPETLEALVLTHEHSDHVSGLYQLSRKLKTTVYVTGPTHQPLS